MALTPEHLGDFLINELRTDTDPGRRKAKFAALKILGISETDALARIDALERGDAFTRTDASARAIADLQALVAYCYLDASNLGLTVNNIYEILNQAHLPSHVEKVIIAGSAILSTDCKRHETDFENMGYEAHFLPRSLEGFEADVDSVLVSFILKLLLTYNSTNRLLVIGTADGNNNKGLPSFFDTVMHAIRRGWRVRLVCRNPNRKYVELAQQYPNQLEIVLIRATSIKSCSSTASTPPLSRNGSSTSSTSLRCETDFDSLSSRTSPPSFSSQSSRSSLSSLSSPSPSPPPLLLLPPPIGDQAQDDDKDWKCPKCFKSNFPWNSICRGCNSKK
jgi:hypothetical protein